jgi:hypothetical protein
VWRQKPWWDPVNFLYWQSLNDVVLAF